MSPSWPWFCEVYALFGSENQQVHQIEADHVQVRKISGSEMFYNPWPEPLEDDKEGSVKPRPKPKKKSVGKKRRGRARWSDLVSRFDDTEGACLVLAQASAVAQVAQMSGSPTTEGP